MSGFSGLTTLRDGISGELYFLERESGRSYRRIAGSIVWPFGEAEGCVIVLGEARSPLPVLGEETRLVFKLAEFQSQSVSELADALPVFGKKWKADYWATPTADKRACLIDKLNDSLRLRREPKIRYGDPQGWQGRGEGLLPFYHALVQRRTMDRKTLILNGGKCVDELGRMAFEDIGKSPACFPSAAALCFALAEIDIGNRGFGGKRMDDGPADSLGGY